MLLLTSVVRTVPGTAALYHASEEGIGAWVQSLEKLGRVGSGSAGQSVAPWAAPGSPRAFPGVLVVAGAAPARPAGGPYRTASGILVAVGALALAVDGATYGLGL